MQKTADGNPGWSRARLDHFLSNTREGRQNRPKRVGRNKRHKEHEEIGEGQTPSRKIFRLVTSSRGDNQTKTTPKNSFSVQTGADKKGLRRVKIPSPSQRRKTT